MFFFSGINVILISCASISSPHFYHLIQSIWVFHRNVRFSKGFKLPNYLWQVLVTHRTEILTVYLSELNASNRRHLLFSAFFCIDLLYVNDVACELKLSWPTILVLFQAFGFLKDCLTPGWFFPPPSSVRKRKPPLSHILKILLSS